MAIRPASSSRARALDRGVPRWEPPRRGRGRLLLGFGAGLFVVALGLAVAVLALSGVALAGDPVALARVRVGALGGKLERVRAVGADGAAIPLAVHDGRLTPLRKIAPGELVSVNVVVRSPGLLAWALGSTRRVHLTVRAPVAAVASRWLTVATGTAVRVSFAQPVAAVAYGTAGGAGSAGGLARHALGGARRSVSLGHRPATGTTALAAAARPWERLGAPVAVSWFPPSRAPIVVASPAPGGHIAPAEPIRLTFSRPVDEVLGSAQPRLAPGTPGRWRQTDTHTLVFTPSGWGAPFDSPLRVELPHAVAVADTAGSTHSAGQIEWTVPGGSTLRLQQLLADAGYLPLAWQPAGAAVARTPTAEVQAAVEPPRGSFSWRYGNTPGELRALWSEGEANTIVKGAVMTFENERGLTVDGVAGAGVWHALLSDAIAGKRHAGGYSYVYVHRESSPESMTLWHAGRTVVSSPANTGIAGAETELGTFPVFEHIPEGTMSGTNPDGSHYDDPGIKWISYFNGGDALHNFNRSSFGTPQSLGCVELPLAVSAQIWPYTPIGTLVTIEH